VTSGVPQLLERLRAGDESALNDLVKSLYDELHLIAARHLRGERPGLTLKTTVLVHEAYLKLIGDHQRGFADRVHFLAVVSRVMRQVLVDYARARAAKKRDGNATFLSVDMGGTQAPNKRSFWTWIAQWRRWRTKINRWHSSLRCAISEA
jgi:RNA polymerase sigma factor (TIGR02999 family)